MSISKEKLLEFIEFAIKSNLKEASRPEEKALHPRTYWLGRANSYRNVKKRIEDGEFDD